jgi:geranylgeranyl pyrophosphate synthase
LSNLAFFDPIRDDLEQVETLLREHHPEHHEIIGAAVDRLVNAGGKRFRPVLVLLSARLCGADVNQAVLAAAAVELLHTASLVHDDLIDNSPVRRGLETLNYHQPPGATVLVGDYLFARAAHLASQTKNAWWMQRFAETLMDICSGEVQQMFGGQCLQTSRQEYEQRILAKTASLVALSAETGAILAGADEEATESLRTFGERLGLAFQIVDDVLDFVGDKETLGKPVGSDLQSGVITLPLLLFLESEPDHPAVRRALQGNGSGDAMKEAAQAVADSPAIEQALEVARRYADQAGEALREFSDSSFRKALIGLAAFTVQRSF